METKERKAKEMEEKREAEKRKIKEKEEKKREKKEREAKKREGKGKGKGKEKEKEEEEKEKEKEKEEEKEQMKDEANAEKDKRKLLCGLVDVRPDYLVDVYKMDKDNSGLFFTNFIGEIKSEEATENDKYIDIYRCATFSKLLMIHKNLSSVMSVRVIGAECTFYLLNVQGKNLYTMIELGKITLPTTINKFFFTSKYLKMLLKIVQVYKKNCFSERNIKHTHTPRLNPMKVFVNPREEKKGQNDTETQEEDI